MVVCKFFLQGNCRFGDSCRNEHPANAAGGGGGGGFGSQNRFGALQNTGNRFGGANDNTKNWNITTTDVKNDLNDGSGRPKWILSSYGPGRGAPASLFEGNEFSPEEIRLRFYELASQGKGDEADREAIQLWSKSEQDMRNVANNADDVIKFMEAANNKHPNRYDYLSADGKKTKDQIATEAQSMSGNANQNQTSGFGAGGGFGQSPTTSNPFSKPATAAFGQPAVPSAFGSSPFGKPAVPSGFGQPAFGQSGFGASNTASSGAFGQNTATSSPFSQPSAAGAAAGAFGKPAFGASGFGQSAFGQSAQPAQSAITTSPFGQSSQTPAFGNSGFGQPAAKNPFSAPSAAAGFGSPSTGFGQPAQSSPFGQAAQPSSGFGQPSQPNSGFGQANKSGFGQVGFGQSPFGQPAQPSSGFGQSGFGQTAQPAKASPFGQAAASPSPFGGNVSTASPFGQSAQSIPNPFAAKPPTTQEVSMDADGSTTEATRQPAQSNPFSAPPAITLTQASLPSSSGFPSQSPSANATVSSPAPKPNNSTSGSPGNLASGSHTPLHYSQTLPTAPTQTDMSKNVISYRNQRVRYLNPGPQDATQTSTGNKPEIPCYNRPDGRGWEKIWFPDAATTTEVAILGREDQLLDLQAKAEDYTDEIKALYKGLSDTGGFPGGKMPLVPPMREWCAYDF